MPVNERVQEAPVGTLRAAFAGIGRFLKITDKIRSKPTAGEVPAEAKATATAQTAPKAAAPAATVEPETTATVETPEAEAAPEGAVATPEDTVTPDAVPESVAPEATVEPETTATAEAAPTAETAEPKPTADAEPAAEAATEAPAGELPLANYDTLTIASVRARLRNLSIAQLGQLVDHEKSHANREDFIAAFERRIAKVQSES